MSTAWAFASTTTAPLIPDKILPNLYLSDIHTAAAVLSPNYNAPGLDRPKIKYVLTIIDKPEKQPKVPAGRESEFVMKIHLTRDLPTSDILGFLPEACKFIDDARKNNDGGVLVHCQKGISRSAALVIAYVMQDSMMNYAQALQFVRGGRSKVWPNEGFQEQLILWCVMGYSTHDADGNERPEYLEWKAKNQKELERLIELEKVEPKW